MLYERCCIEDLRMTRNDCLKDERAQGEHVQNEQCAQREQIKLSKD